MIWTHPNFLVVLATLFVSLNHKKLPTGTEDQLGSDRRTGPVAYAALVAEAVPALADDEQLV